MNNSLALEKMRSGEISAVVHVVGKPNDLFVKFKPGFHFLPIADLSPFSDYYVPARLEATDYPNLIQDGGIQTIAVPTVLAVFNWPKNSDRYRRVARFIEAYFAKFHELQRTPFQPKWQEINIAGTVPGWTRYHVAEEILAKAVAVKSSSPEALLEARFGSFLADRATATKTPLPTSADHEALFKEFLRWQGQ